MSKEKNGYCARAHFKWAAAVLSIMAVGMTSLGFLTLASSSAAVAKAESMEPRLRTLEQSEAAQTEQFRYISKQLDSIERKLK